jgi:hypothetical protein
MYPFSLVSYGKDLLLFLVFLVLVFYIPGKLTLTKLRITLNAPEPLSITLVIGLLVFTLLSYILSWFHATNFLIPILIFINYLFWTTPKQATLIEKKHRIPLLIVTILSCIFVLPMLTSGIFGNLAIYHTDDIIHLGYISEFINHFPPYNPGVADFPLLGYHFFYDFVMAMTNKITGIRIEYLYFHFYPVITALLLGLGIYSLIFSWRKNRGAGLFATFFAFFGGSFGFLLRLQGHSNATLGSTFGIDQPATAILNPPYSISLVLIIIGLFFAYEYMQTKKIGWAILLGLTAGLAPMFKIYAGMLLLSTLIFVTIIDVFQKRFRILFLDVFVALLVFGTYGIFSGKGGFLLWAPLWAPHKVFTEGMPWYGYEEKIYTFSKFGMWHRILKTELYGIFLYIIGNLGTRIVGVLLLLMFWLKTRKPPSLFTVLIFLLFCISMGIPLFFLQSIKVFEIIQMAWYGMLFMSLLASYGFSRSVSIVPTKILKVILLIFLFACTLPSTYENFINTVYPGERRVKDMINQKPYYSVLKFLRTDPSYDATVLELPQKNDSPTWLSVMSWYRMTLPYLPAFANKRSFFHSQNIDFPNVTSEPQTEQIIQLLHLENMTGEESTFSGTLKTVYANLRKKHIRYIVSPFVLVNLQKLKTVTEVYTAPPFSVYTVEYRVQ